jgi:hypothetical protein
LESAVDLSGGPNAVIAAIDNSRIGDALLLTYQPAPTDPPLPAGPCQIRFHWHVMVSSPSSSLYSTQYQIYASCWFGGAPASTLVVETPTNQIFISDIFNIQLNTPSSFNVAFNSITYAGGGLPPLASVRARFGLLGAEVFDALGNRLHPSKWTLYRVGAPGGDPQPLINSFPEPAPLTLTIQPTPGQPGQVDLVFWPLSPLVNYTVETSPDLSPASWTPLTGTTQADNGETRTVTDPNATGERKFYRVVTSPL